MGDFNDIFFLDLVSISLIGEGVRCMICLQAVSGLGDRTGVLFNLLAILLIWYVNDIIYSVTYSIVFTAI